MITETELMKGFKYVGKSIPIGDAEAKATGTVRYTGDMEFPNMLYAKFVYSPYPHARIINIDTESAEKVPGVVKIYSYKNTPKTTFNSQVWFLGQNAIEDQVLFSEEVRYAGDFVAAVVAENKKVAEQAAKLIKIDYEQLEFVINPKKAVPFFNVEFKCGDIEKAFKGDVFISEDTVETQKIHHAAMENHAVISEFDPVSNKVIVYSPCQIMFSVRLIVAKVLGLPLNKVKVVKTVMGGSFGGKQEVILEPYAAFFAMDLKRPVKIEFERTESIRSTRTRTKTIGNVKTAVDKEGRIVGRDIELLLDTGAYTSNGAVISMAMGRKVFRLYKIMNQRYRASVVRTNTPIAGAARGYGSPQIHAITEINIDNTARRLGIDPLEFRLKNLVEPYALDPSGGPPLGNIRIIDCVKKGAEEFGWKGKWQKVGSGGRYKYGVGMACATHVNGYYGAYQDFTTMTLKMLEDGTLILNASLHDLGTGTTTIMKQIIAEVMDVDIRHIEVPEGDTETSPYDVGCHASRVTHVCGACAKMVSEKLREQFVNECAKILGVTPYEIVMEDGFVYTLQNPDIKYSYGELASLIQRKNHVELIQTITYESKDNPASAGVNFAEVEVDTLLGLVKVKRIVAVFDVGKAINPGMVEGQIHGGIQMGLGFALMEDLEIDEKTGQLKSDRFSRYNMFNAPEMPVIDVFLIEKGGDLGPFGAKSIGEIATIPTAPAVVNAVNNALSTYMCKMPLKPERIIAELKKGR
ncbi:xanthine dehydrogenase family protein molybdopterin-binding subunit [Thermosediminibacter litoriperuensis]|uniref:CO/xanthine dehydrogenase Mo-binding subunit n=1 Tax=Thermosediminibacter litoriperuensis TaxID=291989 RepID=A0A5S5AKA5_9FIRM|nr:molybdopterin cofactor-binding domain-containing protein [Thermosediminibacter litoriperuensis]TYP51600.1 CO/xanthine dehydrogenase Mo-binding subunit [Thermosediminibacter litoriperuensis]